MIYNLQWNIEKKIYSCAGEYESLFHIYIAIKERYKNVSTETRDIYIHCINASGQYIDLKGGVIPRLAAKGNERTLIAKGLQQYKKFPI